MRRRSRPFVLSSLVVLVLVMSLFIAGGTVGATRGGGNPGSSEPEIIPGRYIVTFKQDVPARGKLTAGRGLGAVTPRHVYQGTFNGFAAELTAEQVAALEADPDVVSVRPDTLLRAWADTVPTGVRRTWAHRNAETEIGSGASVDVDVAVIDSGVDTDHPDLNVAGGINCVAGEDPNAYNDLNGHGTHVAGTVGAKDNGSGVVGVAPGARIWAVRVLDASGSGSESDVMCGVNWVTERANQIEVANMSLGGLGPEGSCADGGMHGAICASVAAGVTYVVAAGNESSPSENYVPASYDEVITVSAITDTDGYAGSLGPDSFLIGEDDSLANYSNFGPDVDIAAPGSNIRSTWKGGYYMTISGTSMASPHVAGAAAIYRVVNPGANPQSVREGILDVAWDQASFEGFTGDTDGYAEPLLNVGSIGGDPLPLPTPECSFAPELAVPGTAVTIACTRFEPSDTIRVFWENEEGRYKATFRSKLDGTATGRMTIPDATAGPHTVIIRGEKAGQRGEYTMLVGPRMRMYSNAGKVDQSISVYLKGFGGAEVVSIYWTKGEVETWVRDVTTNEVGSATASFKVPESAGGVYTIRAVGETSGVSASVDFTVNQSIATTPTSGKVGATVEVRVRGFEPNTSISVRWQEVNRPLATLHTATTSDKGSLTFSFVVPEATNGKHTMRAVSASGIRAFADFRVTPTVIMAPDEGPAGTEIALAMTGYGPGEQVDIRWYDAVQSSYVITSVTATDLGSATASFSAPNAKTGSHKVEAVGLVSGAKGSDYFYTRAGISLDPGNGPTGTTVTATMSGYKDGETITIRWYRTTYQYTAITTTTANPDGTATATFDVPSDATLGSHKVEAVSASYIRATTAFVVE